MRFINRKNSFGQLQRICIGMLVLMVVLGSLSMPVNAEPILPPTISQEPQDYTVNEGNTPSVTLSVYATGSGTLSYQWYRSSNNVDWVQLPNNATNATLTVATSSAVIGYYYVVVTNTDGGSSASKSSRTAKVQVDAVVGADAPIIAVEDQPQDVTVNEGVSVTLSVYATGSGTLSYQWYRNSSNSTNGASALQGATADTLNVPTSNAGTNFYYVVVTNTDNSVLGVKTAMTTSHIAEVKVNDLADAVAPTIDVHPQPSTTVNEGQTVTLSVYATVGGVGTLTYQWYRNSSNSTNGGYAILGAENDTFSVPTSNAHTTYYYVKVTNTDVSVPGTQKASTTSNIVSVAVIDVTPPSVSITSLERSPTKKASFGVQIRFSEPVTGFVAGDIIVTNGSVSNLQTADNILYTADIMPTSDGEVNVGVAAGVAIDAVGHWNTAATEYRIDYDSIAPTVSITSAENNLTNNTPFSVTLTFSEAITSLGAGDITVTNGSAGHIQTTDNIVYTAKITPTSDGEVKVGLAANVTIDMAGNQNAAATEYSIDYDGTAPAVSITSAEINSTSKKPFSVTITFSEAVNGFTLADITVVNGSASNLQTTNNLVFTADITPSSGGTVKVNVAANAAADIAGNGNSAAAEYSISYSAPYTPTESGSNNAETSAEEVPTPTIVLYINGKAENVGNATLTKKNNKIFTTFVFDQQKVEQKLGSEGTGIVIAIEDKQHSNVLTGELNGQLIKYLENKQAVIQIKTEQVIYKLSVQHLNIDAISSQLGDKVALKDITVSIEIELPSDDKLKAIGSAIEKQSLTLIAPPITFTVKAKYGDSSIELKEFKAYAERRLKLPAGTNPNKITTGVIVDSDGTVHHVPTKIIMADGRYYAVINSLTNRTYSVVWNQIQFKDMTKNWAKNIVHNMASRMIIHGTGNDNFSPNVDISRVDFIETIVRGLGILPEAGTSPFRDVNSSDKYSGAINAAFAHQLVLGNPEGSFLPNDKITREQAMVIIAAAMRITGLTTQIPSSASDKGLQSFADASEVSSWARDSVEASIKAGILEGVNATELAPKKYITRAEVAAIVERLLRKSGLI